jgi:hypothetical protein
MTVHEWMETNFKHDKPENIWYNGKYREDRSIYWQVYQRWLDCDKDVDKLWLDYEQGCQWDLFCLLPKEFITREFCVSLCEEIIDYFGLHEERTEYWWAEKDGMLKPHYDGYWHTIVGVLNYQTSLKRKGIRYADNPDFWRIVWNKIPKISTIIETVKKEI